MTDTTLCHYTITSGHVRHSPRSEVSDAVIAQIRPILRPGVRPLPGPPGYDIRITVDGSALAVTISRARDGAPLVTFVACPDEDAIARAVAASGAVPAVPLTAPACLVDLHPTITTAHDALGWLGDAERCLAWAWIEEARSRA
jgi:hypothetical protein